MLRRKSSQRRLEAEKSAAVMAAAQLGVGVTSDHHSLMEAAGAGADADGAAAPEPAAAAVGMGGGGVDKPTDAVDLTAVRREIAESLYDRTHDDGSLGPLMLRFAWHNAGTWDKEKRTGGTNGCTMQFPAERADPENAGFDKAVAVLEKIHLRHPYLSKADLYALAGTVAIEAMGGPAIAFQTGRQDWSEAQATECNGPSGCPFGDGAHNPCGSRLPAADLGPDPDAPRGCPMHVREKPTIDAIRGTFARMGFDAKETVCLSVLGHQFGRCHPDVSGFEHP
jgi:cytochrome c peroxidase